ncbi:DEAD/DEAH box helicase family protein [Pseudovibrio sp. JE062]|uniref:DEAD/DEAH box helicase family protein n=1 Tax=Pseudovibrio sp. JE062 TaxID=439495 RepID=UPI000186B993|nr:DEAD/DEAH box helicase family protein [Pseudovibrio sp. JE062]EEA93583.1 Type III restriction enzyme, res subunit family [Pseudovibrio sp. JE062]
MSFNELKFQASWREYQERVLAELDTHLDDDHLHVVAAPGSGKTVLGLEVMRRIGQPAIILAPTITIRNQWIDRLTSMFLPDGVEKPSWISKDIRNPRFLTVITYQALHAAFSNQDIDEELQDVEDEADDKPQIKCSKSVDINALLAAQNIQVLVLDEAHHLRNEWWKALIKLKGTLSKPKIVSLTASPPYDVDYREWQKYEELCGPIDAEISVPELVKRGDLCPHQDYVYFALPTQNEARKLWEFKRGISEFYRKLVTSKRFLEAISKHPWVRDTDQCVDDILEEPQYFSSIIIFLNAIGFPPPDAALQILGAQSSNIPEFDHVWLEVLLTNVLYTHADDFSEYEDLLAGMRRELKSLGAIERKKIRISNTKEIKKLLASSMGKMEGIEKITRAEATSLGNNLRLVILADYIRAAELPSSAETIRPIKKIGVVPIFEYLRREGISKIKLGVLTGSLIIIPKSAVSILERVAQESHIDPTHIRFSELAHDTAFVQVHISGEQKQRIVHLITEVFNAGGITTLVGTQALLGEGWDAPSVNALILASFVGSFMLSTQMRGRAIRIDPKQPDKTANIWHLASVDLKSLREQLNLSDEDKEASKQYAPDPFDDLSQDLGEDINLLKRRFRAFEGVTYSEPPVIENGVRRLDLAKVKWRAGSVDELNQLMLSRAAARASLHDKWKAALVGSSPRPEMRENVVTNSGPEGFMLLNTLRFLLFSTFWIVIFLIAQILAGYRDGMSLPVMLIVGALLLAYYIGPELMKALRLTVRNGTIENSVEQVGQSVLETLRFMGVVRTNPKHLRFQSVQKGSGIVYCRLEGATTSETRQFLEAMQEVLGPSDNPRYLLVRPSRLFGLSRTDYHPVPKLIGQSKKNAEYFAQRWEHNVGRSDLVYTRSSEGRHVLLKARMKSFASGFQKKTDRRSVWE